MGLGKSFKKAVKSVTKPVKQAYSNTVGKAADVLWNEPTKGLREEAKDIMGDHLYNLASAVGSAIASDGLSFGTDVTGGLGQAASMKHQADKIQEDDVVAAAYAAAALIGAGAAAGEAGLFSGGAETAAGTAAGVGTGAAAAEAAAAGGSSLGTYLTAGLAAAGIGASAYGTMQQAKIAKEASREQAAAIAKANAAAESAARESEILRKQALLASQKSMAARRAAAGAIANKLKNTKTFLGSEEEKLGD